MIDQMRIIYTVTLEPESRICWSYYNIKGPARIEYLPAYAEILAKKFIKDTEIIVHGGIYEEE